MHRKRNTISRSWPVPRKGTKYVAVPTHNQNDSIPLCIIARDVLGIVRNSKELKRALNEEKVLLNNRPVKETNYPVSLFDILSLPEMKKNYCAMLDDKRKIRLKEVNDKEAGFRTYKVIGKKFLKNKMIQVNLINGRNILTSEKISVGDSVIIGLKDRKVVKIIRLEKGVTGHVFKGKHAGNKGKVEEIIYRGGKQLARIITDKGRINVWTKNIIVAEH